MSQVDKVGLKQPKVARFQLKNKCLKMIFFIDIFENLDLVSEMYISEISKSKIVDYKAQKMTIL